jgi:hypothetical protein
VCRVGLIVYFLWVITIELFDAVMLWLTKRWIKFSVVLWRNHLWTGSCMAEYFKIRKGQIQKGFKILFTSSLTNSLYYLVSGIGKFGSVWKVYLWRVFVEGFFERHSVCPCRCILMESCWLLLQCYRIFRFFFVVYL